jgi:hypothetical protein
VNPENNGEKKEKKKKEQEKGVNGRIKIKSLRPPTFLETLTSCVQKRQLAPAAAVHPVVS